MDPAPKEDARGEADRDGLAAVAIIIIAVLFIVLVVASIV